MISSKDQYIAWLEAQFTVDDWDDYETYLAAQDAPWLDPHESRPEGSRLPALQDAIDYAADTDDYESWLEDEEWIRRGC